jgi:hypothetical protein
MVRKQANAYFPYERERPEMQTNCANDILKPFQDILNALANRKKTADRQQNSEAHDTVHNYSTSGRHSASRRVQAIRSRTVKPFRIWDRLRDSLTSPENMCAEMQVLAQSISSTIKPEELPTPLESCDEPPKSAAALARAHSTNTRLRSLELYLENGESMQVG